MTLLLALACASSPTVAPPPPTPAPAAAPAPAAPPAPAAAPAAGDAWTVDGAASTVTASVHKLLGGHEIGFPGLSGSVHLAAGALTGVDVSLPIASLTVDAEKLRTHLLTPDFFDAATFPDAQFHSTSVEAGATPTVHGTLSVHGKQKELSFPVTGAVEGTTYTGTAEIKLDRRDFALVYPGKPDNLIQDAVELHVKLVAHAP